LHNDTPLSIAIGADYFQMADVFKTSLQLLRPTFTFLGVVEAVTAAVAISAQSERQASYLWTVLKDYDQTFQTYRGMADEQGFQLLHGTNDVHQRIFGQPMVARHVQVTDVSRYFFIHEFFENTFRSRIIKFLVDIWFNAQRSVY
jgi:hypothetical protein